MNEKLYLFNPFNIKKVDNKKIEELYKEVMNGLMEEPNTMYEYAHNIEVYSNLNYLNGEVIARLTEDLINLKTKIEIGKATKSVDERKNWNVERDGKQPAMVYFEALGTKFCEKEIKLLARKECSLKRFKTAYSSIEEKINALKKKMDSIKYEEFNE